ncbi:MAG: 50S ribosomal protein L34 [Planctomycetota bacterium]
MKLNVRNSKIKKKRKSGFRARMKTKSGRKILNGRRKIGRHLTSYH